MRNKFLAFLGNLILTMLFAVTVAAFILIITKIMNEKMGKVGVLLGLVSGAIVLLSILLFLNKIQFRATETRKGKKLESGKKK